MDVRFLINTKTRRIVFIEAGKEFVDDLLSILTMPIGYIAEFLSKEFGSLTNLYESRKKMSHIFTRQSNILWQFFDCRNNIFSKADIEIGDGECYVCPRARPNSKRTHNMSIDYGEECRCGKTIDRCVDLQQASGYVKYKDLFLITDDLKITLSSMPNSRTILDHLNIKDFADVQDRTVSVDIVKVSVVGFTSNFFDRFCYRDIYGTNINNCQACKLAEACLVSHSTTVFTDVFGPEFF
ncbi:hypothetical protein SUGI_0131690 [Cryptomeria japonica]|uniref:uncharacterized protein LOC131048681 n=1 Tax=Cryptomeria japonica TaxID=3369 RepID=UPI002408D11D|nr:uncharacterized protein LOC131048681 [Cryptomeria japonica]GLJ10607.1 hypothetical protein SUGI_0131690 [Cryptomeria japonica]